MVVDDVLVEKVKLAIEAAFAYEVATSGKRKLGITGEVGEILVCYQMGLRLMLDPRSVGYDALDSRGARIQIKTRRSESDGLPTDAGRVSSFSEHKFDYALLGLLDHQYRLCEIWQADYDHLRPIIDKQKRHNPNLSLFKRVAHRVFP
jgi:hypothetical protein